MGTYADLEIEREQREYGQRIMRESLATHDLHGATPTPKRVAVLEVDLAPLRAFAAEPDDPLTVHTPSPHHVQVRDPDGKVFAEWWPSKGSTMKDGKRGPKCRTAADLVAWLREA